MDVLDISRRSTFYKEKRARAYDIPLAAIQKRGGGRPLTDDVSEEADAADAPDLPETAGDAQQRLDTVADGMGHEEATSVDAVEQTTGESEKEREQLDTQESGEQAEIREHVQQAIAALQALEEAL